MNLPEGYIEGIERVSRVVEFVYPFEGNSKERYLKWLYDNKIGEDTYLKEAQDVGTFVHLQMENLILDIEIQTDDELYELHNDEIQYGFDYILGLGFFHKLQTEVVVKDEHNRFQGTIDLVKIDEENKKVWLYDWKTWGIAKKRFGLPNQYRKPYSKLKKVALQLSLYAETYRQKGYTIEGIYAVYLHETGAYDYSLPLYTKEEINNILADFAVKDVGLPKDFTLIMDYPMKIEVQTVIPDEAYSKASVVLEEGDFKGKTPEECIEECIRLQKELLAKYKA